MASGDAILPEQATIYITSTSIAPSALASSDSVTAEVTNYSESGGEEDVESVMVYGGGNIDKVKPRTQMEVSFDIVLRYNSTAATMLKWDSYKWGGTSTISSDGDAPSKRIYVQFTDGTLYYTRAYDNAKGYTFEPGAAADDMLKGTITFKLSPTDADGNPNFKGVATAATSVTWA